MEEQGGLRPDEAQIIRVGRRGHNDVEYVACSRVDDGRTSSRERIHQPLGALGATKDPDSRLSPLEVPNEALAGNAQLKGWGSPFDARPRHVDFKAVSRTTREQLATDATSSSIVDVLHDAGDDDLMTAEQTPNPTPSVGATDGDGTGLLLTFSLLTGAETCCSEGAVGR